MFNCLAPNIKGKDGAVSLSNIHSSTLDKQSKQRFPLELLKIMKRKAEDLLLAEPKSRSGKKALKFIIGVVEEKADVDVSFKRGTSALHHSCDTQIGSWQEPLWLLVMAK